MRNRLAAALIIGFAALSASSASAASWIKTQSGPMLIVGTALPDGNKLGVRCTMNTAEAAWKGEMVLVYAGSGNARSLSSLRLSFDNGQTIDLHENGPKIRAENGKVRVEFGPDRARYSWLYQIAKNLASANAVTITAPELGVERRFGLKGSSRAVQPILDSACLPQF